MCSFVFKHSRGSGVDDGFLAIVCYFDDGNATLYVIAPSLIYRQRRCRLPLFIMFPGAAVSV